MDKPGKDQFAQMMMDAIRKAGETGEKDGFWICKLKSNNP
jgi:hypothetical protein